MDLHPDVVNWLQKMGYNGGIPDNLINICNNSTKFIWDQLMQNVCPKQEIETIRGNIILNRLKTKPLCRQHDFAYKVKEIDIFKQKIEAKEKLKVLKEMVDDKQDKVTQLAQSCKMKDVYLDQLKKRIKENNQRQYLLDAKREQLMLQNLQAEETVTKLKNVTPVEREMGNTAKEITETLEKCAEKLNKHLLENQKLRAHKLNKTVRPCTTVKKKTTHDQSSVATYFSTLENENFSKIAKSCKKDKENANPNVQEGGRKNLKQRMFVLPQIIVEDLEKSSFEQLGVKPLDQSSNSEFSCSITREPKKRESLGILPDSCLEEISGNDTFLCAVGDTDSLFADIPEQTFHKTLPENFKQEIYHNAAVNNELESLLISNNRELIYETLQKLIQNIKMEFTKILSIEKGENGQNKINERSIVQLKFVHLQTELKIIEQRKVLKALVSQIGQKKMHLLSSIKSNKNCIALQDWLESSIKQVAIDATLAAVKKEINDYDVEQQDDNCLQVLLSKMRNIRQEIAKTIQLDQMTIDDLFTAQKRIAATNQDVVSSLWHIRLLRTDIDWMNPLLENVWSEEIRVFNTFPLEYQRRCIYTEPKKFYRDLCVDNYPQNIDITSQADLQLLTEIVDSPFNPPETVLLGVIKSKLKLNLLKSLRNRPCGHLLLKSTAVSFEKLRLQESYIEFALDRLKYLMVSSKANNALTIGEVVKQAMDVYVNMPIKGAISDKTLFKGKNFQFYQRMLDGFL